MNRIYLFLPFFVLTLTIVTCTSCGESPMSTSSYDANSTPSSTISLVTPSLTNTTALGPTKDLTASPESSSLPSCSIVNEEGKLYVLSNEIFYAMGPDDEELDQALASSYPEWANYTENLRYITEPAKVGEIFMNASLQETFALNTAVNLVTVGVSRDWQLPPYGDLYSQALSTGENLVHLWFEWTNKENIRYRYPEVANAATYALYVYFNYDKERLQIWCDAYQGLFGASPLHR